MKPNIRSNGLNPTYDVGKKILDSRLRGNDRLARKKLPET
jgi:hypothetical protein